jgi:hypothetical protein
MLKANNLNEDETRERNPELYDKALYRVGIRYLTHGEVKDEEYSELGVLQRDVVAWLKRVVKKIEHGIDVDE